MIQMNEMIHGVIYSLRIIMHLKGNYVQKQNILNSLVDRHGRIEVYGQWLHENWLDVPNARIYSQRI